MKVSVSFVFHTWIPESQLWLKTRHLICVVWFVEKVFSPLSPVMCFYLNDCRCDNNQSRKKEALMDWRQTLIILLWQNSTYAGTPQILMKWKLGVRCDPCNHVLWFYSGQLLNCPASYSRLLRSTLNPPGVAHQIPALTTQNQGQGRGCEGTRHKKQNGYKKIQQILPGEYISVVFGILTHMTFIGAMVKKISRLM